MTKGALHALQTPGLPPVGGLADDGVADELRRAERECRRWEARRAELIAEAEHRGIAQHLGFRSTTEWLAVVTGEPMPVARRLAAVAEALEQMPETKSAFAAGEVSESKVRLLARAQALAPEQFAEDEARLVAQVAAAPSPGAPHLVASWKREADP